MGFFERLRKGLEKTRKSFFDGIKQLLKAGRIDEETLQELEELLIAADVGHQTTTWIIEKLKQERDDPVVSLKKILVELLEADTTLNLTGSPSVISVVGVNGSGKTTTVAKLASQFQAMGKSVVMAAADTFRAAAIEQLKVWGERINCTVIAHGEGADPAAVAYDAVNHAKSKSKDIVIIDTAGRLHTKKNLMEELRKIHRVVAKLVDGAPHEVLLVIDATTGQNGLVQARIFKEMVNVTGLVITKLDGTAKGGVALAIKHELSLPIKFIGVGESVEDLKPFDANQFVEALLS
ncbi:MAG: Signal recognition particle receptor FtsY [Thermotoga sp. 50_1627]|uniref:signal recognition particle-docking protein FtsY n=1 Tax=Pseudothermotoga sp. TaxID=2033661 RepID=UPI00076C1E82|nr:MAG: Signal recognition particle receptor FtsY [Thermotoga sp. 50_64]KUK25346.1 MAG: Signal recognition particle receptor FtsY [Thermotoga sp. 50_1627]MBC7117028.1 signal recognition particle-docking protein FtsY [Pseudothermotoga sp.]HBT39871.1 signal recognition particle-docking protein FtsY [Pseudothermotoga sp.]HCO97480.1 signal recognition particle-docking protein FtsY [Pseudothermotoga sp.]